jgi:hypothetical protein
MSGFANFMVFIAVQLELHGRILVEKLPVNGFEVTVIRRW